ncbi:MAG: radical SAM protein [Alphaproteobacteria bacterium]|nr:radical SAM protein [Alphaproteobacteria bacterium]
MGRSAKSTFHLLLIKPTHYDDDGYPITWLRSHIPSNTLAALYGLGEDCQRRQVLGPDVDIVIEPMDETNTRVRPERIAARIKRAGGKALICLVGVQSNQFPHAVNLARKFIAAGLQVAMGGFHVSGCLSMLPVIPPEIQEAMDMGIAIYAGEAEEGRFGDVLLDAWNGALKPVYNYMDDLPNLEGAPTPRLPPTALARNEGGMSSFDLGRGCPFQCSFCTIINVQGRKSRFRSADDLEAIIRENYSQGIKSFFITDDNMARNKHWEEFFDRLIELRENEGIDLALIIQVDTQCHRIPNFIAKARWAGVYRVFIGLENVNPDNLLAAKKRQNKITEYRKMLQAWHTSGASTWAGYILGFPGDTRASILRDMEIIKKELPLDILELFILTPLPGSEDHQKMWKQGVWMDPDLNKYDVHHRVVHHPRMADAEFEQTYRDAWAAYYTPEHIETVARRHGSIPGRNPAEPARFMTMFKIVFEAEGVHPLEGGGVRLKYRGDRRHGMKIEPWGLFHLKLAAEFCHKMKIYARLAWQGWRIGRKVKFDPRRLEYTDLALQPVMDDDMDKLSLFAETSGGGAAVDKRRGEDLARARVAAAQNQRLAAAE